MVFVSTLIALSPWPCSTIAALVVPSASWPEAWVWSCCSYRASEVPERTGRAVEGESGVELSSSEGGVGDPDPSVSGGWVAVPVVVRGSPNCSTDVVGTTSPWL